MRADLFDGTDSDADGHSLRSADSHWAGWTIKQPFG